MEQKAAEMKLNVDFSNVTDEQGVLGLAGPKSRDILASLTDSDVGEEGFKFMRAKDIILGGVKCYAIRITYSGKLSLVFISNLTSRWWGDNLVSKKIQMFRRMKKHGGQSTVIRGIAFPLTCYGGFIS